MRRNRVRTWSLAFGATLVVVRAVNVSALELVIDSSTMGPCLATSLCVEVEARLLGTRGVGTESFTLPLPHPDPALWTPAVGSLQMMGGMAIGGTYDTADVVARSSPGSAIVPMAHYYQDFSFLDEQGSTLVTRSVTQTLICEVPAPDAGPTVSCFDGNGGGGVKSFGRGELAWTQGPLTLSAAFSLTPPEPLPGTESFRVNDDVFVSVQYEPVPEPTYGALLLCGAVLLAGQGRGLRSACTRRDGGFSCS